MWKIDFPDMKPFLRILLPAAVCGLLLGACTQRQTTLKFMSYNIRNGRGIDNVQDLGRVAEIINRTAPDIVALQELDAWPDASSPGSWVK